MLPSLFWLSYADFTAILRFSSFLRALVFVYSCRYGLRLGGGCAAGGGGMRVDGERFLSAPGSAPRRVLGSLWEGGGGGGGGGKPQKAPQRARGVGGRGTPRKHKEAQ